MIKAPFIFFWLGIICLLGSYWLPGIDSSLSKTAWLLIVLGLIAGLATALQEREKKKK